MKKSFNIRLMILSLSSIAVAISSFTVHAMGDETCLNKSHLNEPLLPPPPYSALEAPIGQMNNALTPAQIAQVKALLDAHNAGAFRSSVEPRQTSPALQQMRDQSSQKKENCCACSSDCQQCCDGFCEVFCFGICNALAGDPRR